MRHFHPLATAAKEEAQKCFHGYVMGAESNLAPIISNFPGWSLEDADGLWCAAFVYHCCKKAGYSFPPKPSLCCCSLAGCKAWEEFAIGDEHILYIPSSETDFIPAAGDIVLFDRIFHQEEHDHIGVILQNKEKSFLTAEGNINNLSGILERRKDTAIRAYIRLPSKNAWA